LTNCLPERLADWCFQTNITPQWLRLCAWFFHCSMLLHPKSCTSVCTMHSSWPSFAFHSTEMSIGDCMWWLPLWQFFSHFNFDYTATSQILPNLYWQLATKHNSYFTFQTILDIYTVMGPQHLRCSLNGFTSHSNIAILKSFKISILKIRNFQPK